MENQATPAVDRSGVDLAEVRNEAKRYPIDLGNGRDDPDLLFVLGVLALKERRYDAASEFLGRVVVLDGGRADAHHLLGSAYRGLKRPEEALACFAKAARLQGGNPHLHYDVGALHEEAGRIGDAVASFRRAVELDPTHADAHYRMGFLALRAGRLEDAASAFQSTLRTAPGRHDAARGLGGVRMKQGRDADAIEAYRAAVRIRPEDFEANNELGILLARMRRFAEAESCYREALKHKPDYPDAHNNLGNALRNQGKLDEAAACFREALRLRPKYPEAFNNLGITLKHQGKLSEALVHYEKALSLRSDYPEAHNNLGLALASRGKLEAAVVNYQQALRFKPDYVEAAANLADALSGLGRHPEAAAVYKQAIAVRPNEPRLRKSLGNALARMEKYTEAEASHREAIRLAPNYADAHNDLGIALARMGRFAEAVDSYRRAIEASPKYAEAYNNLGNALRHLGRFEESLECYQTALAHKPQYADAYNNLGIAYAEMGRCRDAVENYTQCLRINPNHVDAHMNRALTWLRMGDYAQGWAEYEWRWKKRVLTRRPLIMPQWNGFPLQGRRILLISEQGLGDTLQFVRFAMLLKRNGAGEVILECPERLIPLLSGSPWIDHLVGHGRPLPDYDVYCPLLNVPGLTATSVEAIPAEVPYIHAGPRLVESWGRELGATPGLKVGINWQGNPKYAGDRHRSIPLKFYEPLARIPGVQLFSIQKNAGLEQLDACKGAFPATDLGRRLDESTGPFMDTAAVMKNLDLFITSDTAVAHLAGALGVPTWMALSTTPDWRWMTAREDTPWYPTMRIFRQTEHMAWGPVFDRIADELRSEVKRRARTRAIPVKIAPGELIDKITILEIKAERLADPDKLRHVRDELAMLRQCHESFVFDPEAVRELTAELKEVNATLWTIEDEIRDFDRDDHVDPRFVELARAIYRTNDRRAQIKRRINERLGSDLVEEKSYGGGR
ncbi:DUF6165 family protein [Paludisphaera rhizosphaerae]|uniref:DUF6165 family protein n=1 Tax=Paludisphaera rhizosphaerae TaxID=2711216 RepID=UPI0013EAB7A6|nr:DUF6165 family protein [Paludisphaera rhizosphaerae]